MSGTDTTTDLTTTVARTVTDVLQPRNVLLFGMLAVGLASAGDWTGLPWGFLGALCAGLIPMRLHRVGARARHLGGPARRGPDPAGADLPGDPGLARQPAR